MQLPYFLLFTLTGLLLAILLIKPLNALLLGEMYAANLGIKIKRVRIAIPVLYRFTDGYDDRFLWPDLLHRTCRAAYRPSDAGFVQP